MTFSEAWIEGGDDEDFAKFLDQKPRFSVLPPPPHPYWISHLKGWAERESLPIEYPGYGTVRVPVSRAQLQRFITETLGTQVQIDDPATLFGYVWHKCRDDRIYAIGAEEF